MSKRAILSGVRHTGRALIDSIFGVTGIERNTRRNEPIVEPKQRCTRCGTLCEASLAPGHVCQRSLSPIATVLCAASHEGDARRLLLEAKHRQDSEAINWFLDQMVAMLLVHPTIPLGSNCGIVPIPSRILRTLSRGGSHTQYWARHIARETGSVYLPILTPISSQGQLGRGRVDRLNDVENRFATRGIAVPVHMTSVLLVDDVLTTGATLRSAAMQIDGMRPCPGGIHAIAATEQARLLRS